MRIIEKDEIGSIHIVGENTDTLPMWSINYYIQQFCNNYAKVIIIRRICELAQEGATDYQFLVAKKSASIFPTKSIEETFKYEEDRYLIITSKEQNPDKFWKTIMSYSRPMVFFKDRDKVIPLYDFYYEEAIKLTDLSYHCPIQIDFQGMIDGMIDLVQASSNHEMAQEEHINRQIGVAADNTERICRAAQTINDPRTPEGIKEYANRSLQGLLTKQEQLNRKLGARLDRVDRRV